MNQSCNCGKNVWKKIWTKKQRRGLWVARAKWNLFIFFGINLSYKLYEMTDNLSKSLQWTKMPAIKGKKCADLVIDTLRSMRNDEDFDSFFEVVRKAANPIKPLGKSTLPRKRKKAKLFYPAIRYWLRRT